MRPPMKGYVIPEDEPTERELELMEEIERLKAENERLKARLAAYDAMHRRFCNHDFSQYQSASNAKGLFITMVANLRPGAEDNDE